jgi:hypothetical protein
VTGLATRGARPAVLGIEQVAGLRLRLYLLYDSDIGLVEALDDLHGRWWAVIGSHLRRLDECLPDLKDAERLLSDRVGAEPASDYLQALKSLALQVGLDRIPAFGTHPTNLPLAFPEERSSLTVPFTGYLPSGVAQMQRFLWHLDKAKLYETAEPRRAAPLGGVPRPTFMWLASFGMPISIVDMSIAGTEAQWDPRTETLADARRRLRAQTTLPREALETELARIAKEGKYLFPDTSSNLDRDARLVWWRIRRSWTYEEVAAQSIQKDPWGHTLPAFERHTQAPERNPESPEDAQRRMKPAYAIDQVRKAVRIFARRAQVDVSTESGRRPNRRAAAPVLHQRGGEDRSILASGLRDVRDVVRRR